MGQCNTLRYLGVPIMEKIHMFGANESIMNSSTNINTKLHKRHTDLSFRKVCKAIASKYVSFDFMPGSKNPSGVLSKHWSYNSVKDVSLIIFN